MSRSDRNQSGATVSRMGIRFGAARIVAEVLSHACIGELHEMKLQC